jgi:carboxylesterase
MRARLRFLILGTALLAACDSPMAWEDDWLDGPEVQDPSLNDPGYLLSTRPGTTPADRDRPVIIAAHGFTASTYEWGEFREYAEANGILVSLVLLGGHGRSVEDFRVSTWREWGEPILAEFEALVAQGYTNISLAGASTGGTLILEQVAAGRYRAPVRPRNLLLVDPIVVPGDKNLSLIPVLRYLVGHTVSEGTPEEVRHWYTHRPTAALAELNTLIGRVRSQLRGGVRLPDGTRSMVYKTSRDRTADPVSALLIHRGVKPGPGGANEVRMYDSGLHVLTRLRGRDPAAVTAADRDRQREVFDDMIRRARG